MKYLSDIEIAQKTKLQPIVKVAETAGIDDDCLEQYGRYKAKVDFALLKRKKTREN